MILFYWWHFRWPQAVFTWSRCFQLYWFLNRHIWVVRHVGVVFCVGSFCLYGMRWSEMRKQDNFSDDDFRLFKWLSDQCQQNTQPFQLSWLHSTQEVRELPSTSPCPLQKLFQKCPPVSRVSQQRPWPGGYPGVGVILEGVQNAERRYTVVLFQTGKQAKKKKSLKNSLRSLQD